MPILVATQRVRSERRRFTWENFNGSIYVINEGDGWGYISVSGDKLITLARNILGEPDTHSRNALDETYKTWSDANPYQLADLLYQADMLVS